MVVLFAVGYSLGARASLRRAAAGLAISAVIILTSEGALLAFSQHPGASIGLTFIPILGFWLVGVLVRARRQSVALAGRNAARLRIGQEHITIGFSPVLHPGLKIFV
jgi:hypothetical protein